MSETPRTSAVLDAGFGKDPLDRYANVIVIAKTLERELTAEKERGDRLEKALKDNSSIDVDPCPRGMRFSFCMTHVEDKPIGDGWTFYCAFPRAWALWYQNDSLVMPDTGDSNG